MYRPQLNRYLRVLIAPMLVFLSMQAHAGHKYLPLYNDLGNGDSSHLMLKLADNNAGMPNGSVIKYHQKGNLPNKIKGHYSYSVWNVLDQSGHYYGSITLLSDNNHVLWDGYAAPAVYTGYYLEGIQFAFDNPKQMATLKVKKIHTPVQ